MMESAKVPATVEATASKATVAGPEAAAVAATEAAAVAATEAAAVAGPEAAAHGGRPIGAVRPAVGGGHWRGRCTSDLRWSQRRAAQAAVYNSQTIWKNHGKMVVS